MSLEKLKAKASFNNLDTFKVQTIPNLLITAPYREILQGHIKYCIRKIVIFLINNNFKLMQVLIT